jgi:hypothetical protein
MKTTSLCSTCYDKVPARIFYSPNGVELHKFCPVHGVQTALLERDVAFFDRCGRVQNPIYPGHFLDITGVCSLNCKYCYRPKARHKALPEIQAQIVMPPPYYLIGGEPTEHPDFIEICDEVSGYGPTGVVTNFVRFMDRGELLRAFRRLRPEYSAASYHPESGLSISDIVRHLDRCDITFSSMLIVIDDLGAIPEIVKEVMSLPKRIQTYRIKLASKLWNTTSDSGLFVSDALKVFQGLFEQVVIRPDHRYDYTEFVCGGQMWALVKWHTLDNMNLPYVGCGPTIVAEDGSVNNLILSYILNERGCHAG